MPYWPLSQFYFFYFASLGAFMPYIGPYFKSQGYSSVENGQLLATVMMTKMVAPILSGWLADYTGAGLSIVRFSSLAAAALFLGIFYSGGFYGLLLVMVLFSFFWNSALPLFEAITLTFLRGDTHRYNCIRLWGSIGFMLAVLAGGAAIEQCGYAILPGLLVGLFFGIWVSTLFVPSAPAAPIEQDTTSFFTTLKRPEVILFLTGCFLMQASHAPYYAFYSIYLAENGFSHVTWFGYRLSLTALLWTLAILAEVWLFMRLQGYCRHFSLRQVLLASIALSTMRWLMIGWGGQSVLILSLAQLLHAASFAAFHGVAIQLVHRYFVGKTQSRGQSLYGSVSFGAGGAIGTVVSGYCWAAWGGATTFTMAAVLSLLSWAIVFFGLRSQVVLE